MQPLPIGRQQLSISSIQGDTVYETFFGMSKRPFPAVPHADDFCLLPSFRDSLDGLIHCIQSARGFAILTGGAGTGKTMLAKHLAVQVQPHFTVVYLGSCGYQTRQELLQSMLYELDLDFIGLSEQEARLRLVETARRMAQCGRPLLLIADEVDLLNARLFDELRTLADSAPDGVPLLRGVLCGQFALEERLAEPELASFAQRIGAQHCLQPLTREESAQFIVQRLAACGADEVEEVMTPQALHAIVRAGDGNLRCLAQLCDHSLLLAFGISCKPFGADLVREALQDLKELPLHWNDLVVPDHVDAERETGSAGLHDEMGRDESNREEADEDAVGDTVIVRVPPPPVPRREQPEPDAPPLAVFEVGAEMSGPAMDLAPTLNDPPGSVHETLFDWPQQLSASGPQVPFATHEESFSAAQAPEVREIEIVDRYALLDRIQELPEEKRGSVDLTALTGGGEDLRLDSQAVSSEAGPERIAEYDILRTVRELRSEILSATERHPEFAAGYDDEGESSAALDRDVIEPPVAATPVTVDIEDVHTSAGEAVSALANDSRGRYHDLFTRLSQRRRNVARVGVR